MILKLFKSNSAIVLFALPLVMLLFWMPNFLDNKLIVNVNENSLFHFINISHPLINKITAFILIAFTGIVLNVQINVNEIFERNTYIPALIYVIMMSSISDFQQLHPLIFTNLFWVLAFRRLLNVYNQIQSKSEIFDASMFFILGGIISFPSAFILLLMPWLVLIIIRPFDLKEYLMPVFAIIISFIYLWSYLFITKTTIQELPLESAYKGVVIKANIGYYIIYGLLLISLYFSGFHILKKSNVSSVRFKKITSIIITFLTLSLAAIIYEKFIAKNDAFLLFASVPFSILLSFFFFYASKKWIANTLFYLTILILLMNIYYPQGFAYLNELF